MNTAGRGNVVPNELFFVRDHTRTSRIEVSTWRLKVEGSGVSRPLELSYDDILSLPETSIIRYVERAGNGRSFLEAAYGKAASGTPWKLGATSPAPGCGGISSGRRNPEVTAYGRGRPTRRETGSLPLCPSTSRGTCSTQ